MAVFRMAYRVLSMNKEVPFYTTYAILYTLYFATVGFGEGLRGGMFHCGHDYCFDSILFA